MSERGATLAVEPHWCEVSVSAPCPCCGAAAGCDLLEDGEFVRCRMVTSRWPVLGGGWLHRLDDLSDLGSVAPAS